jgi:type IV pilus biogenesis protein CpaD/CtpE
MIMKRNRTGFSSLLLASFGLVFLTGCSMEEPGHLSLEKARVTQEKIYEKVMLGDADEGYLKALAAHYRKAGSGPVDLTVLYDPQSKTSTAMKASRDSARIVSDLRNYGVQNIDATILPVKDHGDESEILLSYQAYEAQGPENCETMPGYDDNELNIEEGYKLGCTVETLYAKQIARPKDMAGQATNDPHTDGRRSSNIVDGYRTGEPNDTLEGLTATDE